MLVRNAVRLRLVCFKQKTAYEMRISDWSSDVCSSDLNSANGPCRAASTPQLSTASIAPGRARSLSTSISRPRPARRKTTVSPRRRSEEHTSELQSLMRISYAVFCLTTKNQPYYPPQSPTYFHSQSTYAQLTVHITLSRENS